jgi:hypothetical protein
LRRFATLQDRIRTGWMPLAVLVEPAGTGGPFKGR